MKVEITLNVDGREVTRTYHLEDISHRDWNPDINDMAETLQTDDNFLS